MPCVASLLFSPRMPPTRASSLHPTQQLRCFGRCFMSFPWRKRNSFYVSESQHYNVWYYCIYYIKLSEYKASVQTKSEMKMQSKTQTCSFTYFAEWKWNVHQNYILCTSGLPSSIYCRGEYEESLQTTIKQAVQKSLLWLF